MTPLELETHRFGDRGVPWSALEPDNLFAVDAGTRRYLPGYSAAASASGLLDAGAGAWQEIPPGLPLRVWLSGDGTTVGTTTTGDTQPFGAGILPHTGTTPRTTTTYTGAFRIRVGDWGAWDDPAPYDVNHPPPQWRFGVGHSHDPKRDARRDAAHQWLKAWGDLLTRFAPRYPIVVVGMAVGGAISGSALGATGQAATFLAQECYVVAQDYWLGWDELAGTGLPLLRPRVVPTDPAALLADLRAATSPIFPFHDIPVAGYVLRPAVGRGRARFVAYRDHA